MTEFKKFCNELGLNKGCTESEGTQQLKKFVDQKKNLQDKEAFVTLGVPLGSSNKALTKAYRNLSKEYHPDNKNTGDKERYASILKAYKSLTSGNDTDALVENVAQEIFGVQWRSALHGDLQNTDPSSEKTTQGVWSFDEMIQLISKLQVHQGSTFHVNIDRCLKTFYKSLMSPYVRGYSTDFPGRNWNVGQNVICEVSVFIKHGTGPVKPLTQLYDPIDIAENNPNPALKYNSMNDLVQYISNLEVNSGSKFNVNAHYCINKHNGQKVSFPSVWNKESNIQCACTVSITPGKGTVKYLKDLFDPERVAGNNPHPEYLKLYDSVESLAEAISQLRVNKGTKFNVNAEYCLDKTTGNKIDFPSVWSKDANVDCACTISHTLAEDGPILPLTEIFDPMQIAGNNPNPEISNPEL